MLFYKRELKNLIFYLDRLPINRILRKHTAKEQDVRYIIKRLSICLIIICLLSACGKKIYTDEDFEKMPAHELYQLFLDRGLVVPEELTKDHSPEEMADIFKQLFNGMKIGEPATGRYEWYIMAQSAKEIYQELTGEK